MNNVNDVIELFEHLIESALDSDASGVPEADLGDLALKAKDAIALLEGMGGNRVMDKEKTIKCMKSARQLCSNTKGAAFTEMTEWLDEEIVALEQLMQVGGAALRYTFDGALAECPCCGSLDVGAAGNTAHCHGCGLSITKFSHKEALEAWNRRAHPPTQTAAVPEEQLRAEYEGHVLNNRMDDPRNGSLSRDEIFGSYQDPRVERGWDGWKESYRRYASPALVEKAPIPLNIDTKIILGKPNFACFGIANRLRELGRDIPKKSEEEQAAVIHFLLCHYIEHGADWADAASNELRQDANKPPAPASPGDGDKP